MEAYSQVKFPFLIFMSFTPILLYFETANGKGTHSIKCFKKYLMSIPLFTCILLNESESPSSAASVHRLGLSALSLFSVHILIKTIWLLLTIHIHIYK